MECNNFLKDLRKLMDSNASAFNVVQAYNSGLLTFYETLKTLADIEQRRCVREIYAEKEN